MQTERNKYDRLRKIKELNKYNSNKDVVIYSNEKTLKHYEFLNTYENEGQVEIHVDEGVDL